VVKPDLMNLFYEFHAGRLPIHSLNFGIITLLPKIADLGQFDLETKTYWFCRKKKTKEEEMGPLSCTCAEPAWTRRPPGPCEPFGQSGTRRRAAGACTRDWVVLVPDRDERERRTGKGGSRRRCGGS
jgi:hypothetical protein